MRVYMRGSTARVIVVLAFGVVFDCMYPSQSEKQSKTKMRVASGGPHWMEAATAARVVGVPQGHNKERVAGWANPLSLLFFPPAPIDATRLQTRPEFRETEKKQKTRSTAANVNTGSGARAAPCFSAWT